MKESKPNPFAAPLAQRDANRKGPESKTGFGFRCAAGVIGLLMLVYGWVGINSGDWGAGLHGGCTLLLGIQFSFAALTGRWLLGGKIQ